MELYRVILPILDIERAVAFYCTVLGFKGRRISTGRHYFNVGGTILACYDPKTDGDEIKSWEFHPNPYIYITMPDLKEIRNRILKFDLKEVGKIILQPWGKRLFYTDDLFGNSICFVGGNTISKE